MVAEHLKPDEALRAVQLKAPWAEPNPCFWHQLKLFAAMGHKLDPDCEPYKALVLAQQRQLATLNSRPLPKHCQVSLYWGLQSYCALAL